MNLTTHPAWQTLQAHKQTMAGQHMAHWFAKNPQRFNQLSLTIGGILFDYSKNWVTTETIELLAQLAQACDLKNKIELLFAGHPINQTEKRPALHTALRNLTQPELVVDNHNIMPDIQSTLKKMQELTDSIRNQTWVGSTGKPITDIVNIGIGGSHLGPQMTVHALREYAAKHLRCHFVSNMDGSHLDEILAGLNPETSLFIISSKSFTTLETLTNATTVREWLMQKLNSNHIHKHFIAVTASPKKAIAFGIPEQQILTFWDWVGGRYSIWSAVGLPLALMIGMPQFLKFLQGAHEMDHHFQTAPFTQNLPVIMALLGIWYINFFDSSSHAIIPYSHLLQYLPKYMQQADMESNGKSITLKGTNANYMTGPIIWGEQGIHGQHAFYQLLHQTHHLIPIDFILLAKNHSNFKHYQDFLVASGLSQSRALLHGKTRDEIISELLSQGYSKTEAELLAPHKVVPGNRPHTILFIDEMIPYNLGALIALYEHKIFVQGAIWGINSFDQWSVELGKQLLPNILAALNNPQINSAQDESTKNLIKHYVNIKEQS